MFRGGGDFPGLGSTGVSKSRYFARSIAIKYSNFSRFYKKKGPFYKKIPFLELLETPNIRCPVGGSIGGCGARAVSRKTPIYFIKSTKIGIFYRYGYTEITTF